MKVLVGDSLLEKADNYFRNQASELLFKEITGKILEDLDVLTELIEDDISIDFPIAEPVDDGKDGGSKPSTESPSNDKGDPKQDDFQSEGPKGTTPVGGIPTDRTSGINQDFENPNVPKTGDGTIRKTVSPIVAALIALAVAFVLMPNRRKNVI